MVEQDVIARVTMITIDKYVKGWVYNGFGCTVVERGVVVRVTMISIDE